MPGEELRAYWPAVQNEKNAFQKIALKFKVSAIVAARRLFDLELIERDTFFDFYENNKEQGKRRPTTKSSGNFWNTQRWRIGPSLRKRGREGGQGRASLVSGSLQPHWSETKYLRKNAGKDGNSLLNSQAKLPFVLDANVFIGAHRNYYPFDLLSGFWIA